MTGSVQVKHGKYYLALNTYVDGRRKITWVPTGLPADGNKREAERMLKEYLGEADPPEVGPSSDELFSTYLDRWLGIVSFRVDSVTLEGYTHLVKRHIAPYFEKQKVAVKDVNRRMLQTFLDGKLKCGRLDGKGGLSPKTVHELRSVLNQAFNEAIIDELITTNPCTLLRLPPKGKYVAQFYTLEQLDTLLTVARDEPLYPLIYLAVVFGLRRSELLGLRWESVDFENRTLLINHTVVRVMTMVEKDKTKTQSSLRSFPMSDDVCTLLHDLKCTQEQNRKLLGSRYHTSDYVFCWPDGRPYGPDYVSWKFKSILLKNGLPPIRLHELRHSCASLLINNGFGLKDIQEWLGHADIGTTANTYGHLETRRKQRIANTFSDCFSEKC